MTADKVVGDFVERHEAHAGMALDVFDQALEHQQHLRATGHVRVDGHGEHGMFVFAVDPVELVAPHFFEVARVDEAVAVGGF